jgi:hypothetical protein
MNMGQDASGVRRWPVVCGVGRKEAGRPEGSGASGSRDRQ